MATQLRKNLEQAVAALEEIRAVNHRAEARLKGFDSIVQEARDRAATAESSQAREHVQWMQMMHESSEKDVLLRDFTLQVRLHQWLCFQNYINCFLDS